MLGTGTLKVTGSNPLYDVLEVFVRVFITVVVEVIMMSLGVTPTEFVRTFEVTNFGEDICHLCWEFPN